MRMASMIWEQHRQKDRTLPIECIALHMCNHLSQLDLEHAVRTIRRMEDEGSRFLHLEKHLGLGAAFVVSSEASRLMSVQNSPTIIVILITHRGTTAVAKSGPEFKRIVRELELAGVKEQAAEFIDVRNKLEQWYRLRLLEFETTSADPMLPSGAFANMEFEGEFFGQPERAD